MIRLLQVGDFGLRELLLPTADNPFLAFVAPEVRRGETFSDKADMYSIGSVLLLPLLQRHLVLCAGASTW